MNLSQLRDLVLDLRAWTSSGTTFDQRLNKAINLAYRKMSKDVPEVLVPSHESHYIFKDQSTASTKAYVRLETANDTWVLSFRDSAGRHLAHASSTVTWRPQVNGTWDGLMHIEATDAAGVVHRYRCLEFWTAGNAEDAQYFVSIDRPFHEVSGVVLHSFRIHQPTVWLKSDYIRVADVSAWDSSYKDDRLHRIDLALVERHKLRDFRGESNGKPQGIFPNTHMQLRPPRAAPIPFEDAAAPVTDAWASDFVPAGEFTFCYTYAMGVASEKEGEPRYSPGGYPEPVMESPPSPESAKFLVEDGKVAKITMAPIDHMMNFYTGSGLALRDYRSGLRLRLYAARHTTHNDPVLFDTESSPTADKKYYLIADLQTGTDVTLDALRGGYTFKWQIPAILPLTAENGIPDMTRSPSDNQVYRGWSVYPHQEKDFRLDFRMLRPPDALVYDSQRPFVEPDAESALIELVLYYLSLMDGADQAGAQVHLGNYANELKSVRAQHASPAGSVMPSTWDESGMRVWNPAEYKEI